MIWEYKEATIVKKEWTEILNLFGKEGWEYVTARDISEQYDGSIFTVTFKRQKDESSDALKRHMERMEANKRAYELEKLAILTATNNYKSIINMCPVCQQNDAYNQGHDNPWRVCVKCLRPWDGSNRHLFGKAAKVAT